MDAASLLGTLRKLIMEAAPQAACIGLPGAASSPESAAWVAGELAALPTRLIVMTDAELALTAAFGPLGDGIVVCAGTGSVAAVRKAGVRYQVGGHGYLIDDAGSAYDIGRRLLAITLRYRDQGETSLVIQVEEALGEPVDEFVRRMYAAPSERRPVAELSRQLAGIAHPAIDDLLREAAESLVALVDRAQGRFGNLPVALVGGVFRNPAVTTMLQERCGASLSSREPHVAAAYLAMEADR
jgi:N-acetylglucosamine kinase-like BadF-type ATPase